MKPFRGKRMGPQSLPPVFNPSNEGTGGCPDPTGTAPSATFADVCTFRGESAMTGCSEVIRPAGWWPPFGVVV